MKGRWVKGPNLEFFQTLEKQLRTFPRFAKKFQLADHVIAEDLGEITKDVEKLCRDCNFPGMDVLHFRFGETEMKKRGYRPEGTVENRVVYTGTHDNETTRTWFKHLDAAEQERVRTYLQSDEKSISRNLCALALRSRAKWAILPMQDLLGRGARMNHPGTQGEVEDEQERVFLAEAQSSRRASPEFVNSLRSLRLCEGDFLFVPALPDFRL